MHRHLLEEAAHERVASCCKPKVSRIHLHGTSHLLVNVTHQRCRNFKFSSLQFQILKFKFSRLCFKFSGCSGITSSIQVYNFKFSSSECHQVYEKFKLRTRSECAQNNL